MNRRQKIELLIALSQGRKSLTALRTPKLKQHIGVDPATGYTLVTFYIDGKPVDKSLYMDTMQRENRTGPLKINIKRT